MTTRKQRQEARARVAELRAAAHERVAQLPVIKKQARRKRWRRRAVVAALLLWLLFLRCDCGPLRPEADLRVAVADAGIDAGPKPKLPAARVRKPNHDLVGANPRRSWDTGTQLGPAWLDEFRIQVAARSPRLAQCFTGTERPGALRWSVALNPDTGAVSDHELEALTAADVSTQQQECVKRALSNPKYHITPVDRLSVPPRVTLTIEF